MYAHMIASSWRPGSEAARRLGRSSFIPIRHVRKSANPVQGTLRLLPRPSRPLRRRPRATSSVTEKSKTALWSGNPRRLDRPVLRSHGFRRQRAAGGVHHRRCPSRNIAGRLREAGGDLYTAKLRFLLRLLTAHPVLSRHPVCDRRSGGARSSLGAASTADAHSVSSSTCGCEVEYAARRHHAHRPVFRASSNSLNTCRGRDRACTG